MIKRAKRKRGGFSRFASARHPIYRKKTSFMDTLAWERMKLSGMNEWKKGCTKKRMDEYIDE